MRVLFYFGHPSQYLFLRGVIHNLKVKGDLCEILIKSKDVLEQLLIENNETYLNILPEGRTKGNIGTFLGLIKRDFRLYKLIRKQKYSLFIGTDPSLAHIGFIKRIPVITILEDDIHIVPKLAALTFPLTNHILTPTGCKTGRYEYKTIHYNGYMKLAYLHPLQFIKGLPDTNKPYSLIRLSGLEAHHDNGIVGLNHKIVEKLIELLEKKGDVFISSERMLDPKFEPYKLTIKPSQMQHFLAHAALLVSDSQSMSMEAAMLGVPSIRYSDFAGEISVLEELEHKYGLTFGFKPGNSEALFSKINELHELEDLSIEFENRRQRMLTDKIDVTSFMVWFIENYPSSVATMRENPNYQYNFR